MSKEALTNCGYRDKLILESQENVTLLRTEAKSTGNVGRPQMFFALGMHETTGVLKLCPAEFRDSLPTITQMFCVTKVKYVVWIRSDYTYVFSSRSLCIIGTGFIFNIYHQ